MVLKPVKTKQNVNPSSKTLRNLAFESSIFLTISTLYLGKLRVRIPEA